MVMWFFSSDGKTFEKALTGKSGRTERRSVMDQPQYAAKHVKRAPLEQGRKYKSCGSGLDACDGGAVTDDARARLGNGTRAIANQRASCSFAGAPRPRQPSITLAIALSPGARSEARAS